MNGVLVIDKPKSWTSHDVVARVRKTLKIKKAGHGGTLDPLATGVLPIYLNEATKLVPFNLEGTKEYEATLRLGQETDTLDADGTVVAEVEGFSCTREEIEGTLKQFRGTIKQKPPLYSAIKKEGVPLYRRARAGEKPDLPEREAVIFALELTDFSLPYVTLAITCGRGTYIRSLAADIGKALKCGAHVAALRRLRSGRFLISQALSMEGFADLTKRGTIKEKMLRLQDCVDLCMAIQVKEEMAKGIKEGRPLYFKDLPREQGSQIKKGQRVGIYEDPEKLLAIAESDIEGRPGFLPEPGVLRIVRVFHN